MVTTSEQKVIDEYKEKGYFNVHSGAPDFIFYKLKENKTEPTIEDIDINSIEFVEVKYNGDVLSHEQQIWKHILEQLGLNYKLINIQSKQTNSVQIKPRQENAVQNNSNQAHSNQFKPK